ncbi:MAG: alpha/beta fold hydrolase [Aestuariivirga sp.]|uniref:alpha/beta fold hydrolase n=1 Tax=Aestuariivirga sp. TaxID=2650926 RepID=UPI0025C41D9C|nr:alpha/beta hydrolase [Aestuariivirga sp.]MCA3561274.1 alpha/beta fold hydrolase [Aestuariivirga sp.]
MSEPLTLSNPTLMHSKTGSLIMSDPIPLPAPRMIQTKIGQLAVRDTGETPRGGDILVLWPSILADYTIYRAQIMAWAKRHRLVIVDGPGHGDSGPAPGPFTMAQCGQALAQILDRLAISQPVVIVGTSLGGLVGGEFAIAYPERTRALVMLNTPVNAPQRGFGDRFVTWGARRLHRTGMFAQGAAKSFFLPATIARGGPALEDFRRHLRGANGAALATTVRSVLLEREPLAPRMRNIRAPVLFIAGRADKMYPPDSLRQAAETLPQGRFETVESAHISVVDAPQATTALIDGFLASLPAPR